MTINNNGLSVFLCFGYFRTVKGKGPGRQIKGRQRCVRGGRGGGGEREKVRERARARERERERERGRERERERERERWESSTCFVKTNDGDVK